MRWLRAIVLSVLTLTLPAACVSTFDTPEIEGEAATVFLTRTSWHCGLRLPMVDGNYVEFGFGDWAWFAERRESMARLFPTLVLPTRGTICRRTVPGASAGELLPSTVEGEVFELRVDRRRVTKLRDRLESWWYAEPGDFAFDPDRGLAFQEAAWRYSMYWNCYDAVARWLRELGCEVPCATLRTGLRPTGT